MFEAIPKVQTDSREVNQLQDNILGRLNPERRALPSMLVPAGALMPYAGSAAPAGYLFADGSTVDGATYPNLAAALGYEAGSSFALPSPAAYGGVAWIVKT